MSGNGGRLDGRYWKFWTAATGSALGSGMVTVAAPLLVASRSADPLVVSGASAAAALPWLLFTLPAGAVVDRLDRRHVMIVMDLLRVLLVGALGALIMLDRAGLPLIYLVLFLMGTAETVFRSASQALVPDLVDRDSLEHANSWLIGSTMLTAGIIAAPLGALLFHLHGSVPFLANAATYALSAALLLAIAGGYRGTPAMSEARPKGAFLAEIGEGVRWLAGQRLVRTLALLIGLLNITLTAALSILVLVVRERLHAPDWWFGVLVTCMAAGGLLGSAIGPWLVRKVTATWTLRIGLIIEAGLHLVLATSHSTITVAAAFAVFGVHGSLWTIVSMSIRQRLTPPAMQGRVGSVYLFTAAGGNSLGAVLGGALAGWFGLPAPYWVGFVAAVLVVVVTWRVFSPAVIATAYGSAPDTAIPTQATGAEPVPDGAAVGQGSNL